MGVTVDAKTFTPDSLAGDINKVLSTPSFADSAAKVSRVVKDTPRKPTELAADWIEYAIRHDGAMFHQIEGLQQSWYVHLLYFTGFFPYAYAEDKSTSKVIIITIALILRVHRRCAAGVVEVGRLGKVVCALLHG